MRIDKNNEIIDLCGCFFVNRFIIPFAIEKMPTRNSYEDVNSALIERILALSWNILTIKKVIVPRKKADREIINKFVTLFIFPFFIEKMPTRKTHEDASYKLIEEVSTLVSNILKIKANNVILKKGDIEIITKELNDWAQTQPLENQKNTEKAKSKILDSILEKKTELDLSHLSLTALPTNLFKHLTHLKCLNLAYNQLWFFNGAGLKNLSILYLNNNNLLFLDTTDLENLIDLNLCNNQLPFFNGVGLKNLQKLYAMKNEIIGFNGDELSELLDLDLKNNQITNFKGSCLKKIQELNLRFNKLQNLKLTGLENLRILDVSDNPDLFEPYETFSQIPSLTEIDIERTKIPKALT